MFTKNKKSILLTILFFLLFSFLPFERSLAEKDSGLTATVTYSSTSSAIKITVTSYWDSKTETALGRKAEIKLQEIGSEDFYSKELSLFGEKKGTLLFENLKPNTTYQVDVSVLQPTIEADVSSITYVIKGNVTPSSFKAKTQKTPTNNTGTEYFMPGNNTEIINVTPEEAGTNESTDTKKYRLLAPIGEFREAPENLGDYLNKIFLLAIGLCGAIAVIMLIVAGIQYMGEESIFGKANAKDKISDALIGLLIALSAYALLNTINPELLGSNGLNIRAVYVKIDESIHGDNPHTARDGKYCGGKYQAFTDGKSTPWNSDEKERQEVQKYGITVNKNNCTYIGQQNCTSLAGLDTSKVIALKRKCANNCTVEITGGTECWLHSYNTQHLPGNAIVDLKINGLSNYIETDSKVAFIEIWNGERDVPVFTKDSSVFVKERTHYHVKEW